jgi:hypothetical protein
MAAVSYAHAPVEVRNDLTEAHRRAWQRIAAPGAWWDGARRVAIAAEARNAPGCALCRARKSALSPQAVSGSHDHLGALPAPLVEAIHRIRTDPGRLTESWYREIIESGLSDAEYVETVGVVVTVVALDTFARGLGAAPLALPAPIAGAPSGQRPSGTAVECAWVATISPATVAESEADIYGGAPSPAYIRRALTLVPDEARGFFDLVEVQYLPGPAMRDFDREYRAIDHAQIELLAARVSAINQCAY